MSHIPRIRTTHYALVLFADKNFHRIISKFTSLYSMTNKKEESKSSVNLYIFVVVYKSHESLVIK